MKRNYWKFNYICLALSGLFLVGTIWVWRGAIKDQKIRRSEDQVVIKNEDQKIKRSEDQTVKSNDLLFFRSSSLEIVSTTTKQFTSTLPAKFNLAVPFTSQAPEKDWSEPWQDVCEEAALLMLDAYYKGYGLSPLMARDEILKMVKWEEEQGWGRSITIEDIKQMASEYFHLNTLPPNHLTTQPEIKVIENPMVEDIKKFIANRNPVLVVADGKVLPNPHFRNGGPVYHALVIKGYTETEFITNDPGTQFGKGFKYKYHDLMNAIHDWNGGDVKNGRRVVLVLE